jgi:hypothetical protein
VPSSGAGSRPPDWPAFLAEAGEVLPLLAECCFDAVGRFAELEALAAGTPMAGAVAAIRDHVKGFRFASAHAALSRLVETAVAPNSSGERDPA